MLGWIYTCDLLWKYDEPVVHFIENIKTLFVAVFWFISFYTDKNARCFASSYFFMRFCSKYRASNRIEIMKPVSWIKSKCNRYTQRIKLHHISNRAYTVYTYKYGIYCNTGDLEALNMQMSTLLWTFRALQRILLTFWWTAALPYSIK